MQKVLKNPSITTIWPISDRADATTTVRKIKDKLNQYNVISPKEQAFLDKYDQKKAFS